MRTSTTSRRLKCHALYREVSISWKKVLLLIAAALFVYCFVVFDLVSSALRSGVGLGLHWSFFYDRVANVNVPEHVRQTIIHNRTPATKVVPDELSDAGAIWERPSDSLHCPNLSSEILPGRAEEFYQDPFAWQRVSGRHYETYVFSAYYDNRLSPARVVIVGISDEYAIREAVAPGTEFCKIWYPGEDESEILEAEFSVVPEHHGLRFAASLHFCPLKRTDSVPYAVSLIVDKCHQSNNILRVQNHSAEQKRPKVNYTVCVSPLINSYNNYQQLVESVEVNRIFGAQEFVFYNFSTDSVVVPFLNSYLEEGVARIIPWNIPLVDIHYFGQVAALNDCLYRSMFRSRFLVFTDLDELIVPRRHRTWDEMLDAAVEKLQTRKDDEVDSPYTYIFRNTFFPIEWFNESRHATLNPMTRHLGLKTLMLTVREDRIYQPNIRSKYIVRSAILVMVGIHFPFRTLPVFSPKVDIDPWLGLVHHYRDKRIELEDFVTPVFDPNIYRFHDLIISRTRDRYIRISRLNNRT